MRNSGLLRIALLAASAGFVGAPAALAAIGPEAVTVSRGAEGMVISRSVSYADLDLSKEVDRNILKSRVNRVAVQICRDLDIHNPWSLHSSTTFHEPCVKNARADALARIPGARFSSPYRFAGEGD